MKIFSSDIKNLITFMYVIYEYQSMYSIFDIKIKLKYSFDYKITDINIIDFFELFEYILKSNVQRIALFIEEDVDFKEHIVCPEINGKLDFSILEYKNYINDEMWGKRD